MYIENSGFYRLGFEPEVNVGEAEEVWVDALSINELNVEDVEDSYFEGHWLNTGTFGDVTDTAIDFAVLRNGISVDDSENIASAFSFAARSEIFFEDSSGLELEVEHGDEASIFLEQVEDASVEVNRGSTNVVITESGHVDLFTGRGRDTTSLFGSEDVDINTGSGRDDVTTYMSRDVEIDTAAGNDVASLFASEGVVDTGGDSDWLSLVHSRVAYTPGPGRDYVAIDGGETFGFTGDDEPDVVEFVLDGGGEHTLFADGDDTVSVRDRHGNSWDPEDLSYVTPGPDVQLERFALDVEFI